MPSGDEQHVEIDRIGAPEIFERLIDAGNVMILGFFPRLQHGFDCRGPARRIDDAAGQMSLLVLQFVEHS